MKLFLISCLAVVSTISGCESLPESIGSSSIPIISNVATSNVSPEPCDFLKNQAEDYSVNPNPAINSILLMKFFQENQNFPRTYKEASATMKFDSTDKLQSARYCKWSETTKSWNQVIVVKSEDYIGIFSSKITKSSSQNLATTPLDKIGSIVYVADKDNIGLYKRLDQIFPIKQ
jgi:hypothetical protein